MNDDHLFGHGVGVGLLNARKRLWAGGLIFKGHCTAASKSKS